jgi:hypothetical protein
MFALHLAVELDEVKFSSFPLLLPPTYLFSLNF